MGNQTISRNTLVKVVVAIVIAAISLGIVTIGDYSIGSDESEQALSDELKGVTITPGTYTGTATGMESDVTATCTFDETGITSIEVDVSGETAGIGADIGDEMEGQFLAAQGSAVDGVSGATVTSNALMEAVSDCIAQATGGAPAQAAAEAETSEEELPETEEETEAVTEAVTETVTEAEEMTEAAAASSSASADSYVPGTYTASASGMESDVTVTIEVDDSSILSADVDVSGETAGIGADIGDEVTDQILDAQSADIEGVSGATVSSNAVKEALEDCIAQAESGETEEAVAAAEAETETEAVTEIETEAATEAETETETEAVTEAAAETEEMTAAAAASTAVSAGSYVPGTYTAEAKGMESDVKVTIEVDDSSILSADVDVSGETAGIGADIGDEVTEQILDAQSADIDGVSGATVSSNAVKEALEDCIAQAESGEAEEAVTEAAEKETAAEGDYVPGSYTAEAKGMESDVTVTIEVDDSSILSADVDVSGETAGIGADIGDEVTDQILKAQSADIEGVSGATVSSNAVKEALEDCIAQASGNSAVNEDQTEGE